MALENKTASFLLIPKGLLSFASVALSAFKLIYHRPSHEAKKVAGEVLLPWGKKGGENITCFVSGCC